MRKMPPGNLVEVETKTQCNALQKLQNFQDKSVSVMPHPSLNCIRGVISEDELSEVSHEDMLNELSEKRVINAKRITIRRDGKELSTMHIILAFDCHSLPSLSKQDI